MKPGDPTCGTDQAIHTISDVRRFKRQSQNPQRLGSTGGKTGSTKTLSETFPCRSMMGRHTYSDDVAQESGSKEHSFRPDSSIGVPLLDETVKTVEKETLWVEVPPSNANRSYTRLLNVD